MMNAIVDFVLCSLLLLLSGVYCEFGRLFFFCYLRMCDDFPYCEDGNVFIGR